MLNADAKNENRGKTMLTVDDLKNFGADTDTGLARCMGNEGLYLRLVRSLCDDPSFDKLTEAVEAGALKEGFEAAHSLKGVLGNLSLTPIYDKVVEITEHLRNETEMDYKPLIGDLNSLRNDLKKLCG